ncbi:hypothetical protein D9758_009615 [Tetrapyrgos nigripes]|uniref:Tubulin nucleotide-binding domain-like protein n=1 Tax=Tetrapyrgos nigripes TaxID=182062 RepID=A0A8H5LMG1_9AGAR|nr:hypothetical protein D9758_009615 [Tetrapyrgos nigripes]
MREILYLQAGTFANYVGTHFWNTQESYFTYGEDENSFVCHDVSFREGLNAKAKATYCPRLMMFDRKGNYGALARTNSSLFSEEISSSSDLWTGPTAEYKQRQVATSPYQTKLASTPDGIEEFSPNPKDVRYWSDFNRVFYHPRSLCMLPDLPDWQDPEGDWTHGVETFSRYNQETDLMESSVRLFLEECNSFQGMQVMNDTAAFGSFTRSFLTTFRDELSTAPSLVVPLLSDAAPSQRIPTKAPYTSKIINDALYLRDLHELSLLTVPIQTSKTWTSMTGKSLNLDGSLYHASALLSAHTESVTLPLRLTSSRESMDTFAAQLNWNGANQFSQIGGIFPVAFQEPFFEDILDLSIPSRHISMNCFARKDVTRGLDTPILQAYNDWSSSFQSTTFASVHMPAYPLPSSFPDFFKNESILESRNKLPPREVDRNSPRVLRVTPSVTSLSFLASTSETGKLFAAYAKYIETYVERRKSGEQVSMGADELDGLRELSNDLWTIHDGYSIDTDELYSVEADVVDGDGDIGE